MLQVGDKVSVMDDNLEGTVVSQEGSMVTIETTDGFLLDFERDELVVIDAAAEILPPNLEEVSQIIKEKEAFKKPKSKRVKPKERNAPPMEIDLHADKLLPSTKNMGSYDLLSFQLETAKRQLEFAMSKRVQKVVFIHGVGEGVLKAELDYLLSRYDNLKFYDADYKRYGLGATEVYIFQNP